MPSRRKFIQNTSTGAGLFSLSSLATFTTSELEPKKKVVCVGGHPDDPESGCGGTLSKLSAAGHNCTIIYLTRGEAGIPGKQAAEAASIRTKEAEEACKIIGAKPVFAGQVDGDTLVNREWIGRMKNLLEAENPDIVFTHWAVDTHPDHQVASLLTYQAWFRMNRTFTLYYYEVCTGAQTELFSPTEYIDITSFQEQKRKAVYCHVSQDPDGIYQCGHASMEEFRGRCARVKAAEAFIRVNPLL